MKRAFLLENETEDGAGDAVPMATGNAEISVVGTFDGATVTFQDCKFDENWADVLDYTTGAALSITAATNEIVLQCAPGTGRQIRATVANAGASTDLTVFADFGA